jgi:hypothetical protein
MKHIVRFAPAMMLALLLAAGPGCGDDDPVAADEPIEVDAYFSLNVDGPGLQLNNLIYTNAAGTKYSIKVLRFILSDIRLHTDDGKSILLADVHFYDVADGTTQIIHATGLPHANFTGVSFTFGLDETRNVRNRYQSNAKLHAVMQWPTGLGADLGYHYMQLEGNYETSPGGPTAGYTTHTGPRHLDGTNPMYPGVVDATPHHFHFAVEAPFTPTHVHEGGHGELQIFINLNGWYADHLAGDGFDSGYDFAQLDGEPGGQMMMGNLDAQAKLRANGPFCFSATLAAHDGHDH